MCRVYPEEHYFIYAGNSVDIEPDDSQLCQCRALTWKQARELALKNLLAAETRRQKEREQEAAWWSDESLS